MNTIQGDEGFRHWRGHSDCERLHCIDEQVRFNEVGSMSQIGGWIALCLFLSGCSPGYMVRLDASAIKQVDPALVVQLEDLARSKGLVAATVASRDVDSPDKMLTSSYRKELSARWHGHDEIRMSLVYSDAQSTSQTVTVFIENLVRGMDPAVKSQIDALADECYEVLVRALGRDWVTVERGPDSLPLFR